MPYDEEMEARIKKRSPDRKIPMKKRGLGESVIYKARKYVRTLVK